MSRQLVVIADERANVQKSLRKELYPRLRKVGSRVARRWDVPIRFIVERGGWASPPKEEFSGIDVYVYAAPPRQEGNKFLPAPGLGIVNTPIYGVTVPTRLHQKNRGTTKRKSQQSNLLQYRPRDEELAIYGKSVSSPIAVVRPPGRVYILLDILQSFDGSDLLLEALLEEAMPLAAPAAPVRWSAHDVRSSEVQREEYERLALGIVRRELQKFVLHEKKASDSVVSKQRKLNELAVNRERLIAAREALRQRIAEQASEAVLGEMFDDILAIPTIRGVRVEGSLANPKEAGIVIETEALEYEGVYEQEGVREDKLDIGCVKIVVKLALEWNAKHMVTMTRPDYEGTHRPGHIQFTLQDNICFDGDVGNQLRALCQEGDMLSLVHLLLSFIRFESSKKPMENKQDDDDADENEEDSKRPEGPYYPNDAEREKHRERFVRLLGIHRQKVELASIEDELEKLRTQAEQYAGEHMKAREALHIEEANVLGARAVVHAAYGYVADDFASLASLPELDTFIRRGDVCIFRLIRAGGHAPPVMIWLEPKAKRWTIRGFRLLPSGEACISEVNLDLPKPLTKAVHRAFAQGRLALLVRILWAVYQNDMHEAQRIATQLPDPDTAREDPQKQLPLPKGKDEEE